MFNDWFNVVLISDKFLKAKSPKRVTPSGIINSLSKLLLNFAMFEHPLKAYDSIVVGYVNVYDSDANFNDVQITAFVYCFHRFFTLTFTPFCLAISKIADRFLVEDGSSI